LSKDAIATVGMRRGWSALIVLSLGVLMVVLDRTIVYVALPSIRNDLNLSATSLVWVANAYTLAFGGFLLISGRLGDLYGHRRLFLYGLALFTIASLACGLAQTAPVLIASRAVQGVGGAVVTAVALSVIMNMFTESAERARAIGLYSFICIAGGSVGLPLGGILASAFSWHWIFLVNVPIGAVVYFLCLSRLPHADSRQVDTRPDVAGGITITACWVLATYAIIDADDAGWSSTQTVGLLACAAVLMATFCVIEARVPQPLMPLSFFARRNIVISNAVRVLWLAGASTQFFIGLYVQLVLGYGPMEVALTFVPGNLIMAACSLSIAARTVTRLGVTKSLSLSLVMCAIGLALLARAPVNGNLMVDVLPGTILVALSTGIGAVPLLLATMVGVGPREAGLASGVTGTVSMMSNALGLAIFASIAAARTNTLLASGATSSAALTGGYRLGFLLGAICVAAAAIVSAALLAGEARNLKAEDRLA
jgi:EmrB/QacA subfamily drug resistance transporter